MLLADLMMVSALSVYAVRDEAPAQDDPWMDYAQEHLGNTLPFMREEELSFLEPGCQVYLGKRLSAYNAELGELPYAMYPVFADGQVVAIATVMQTEDGELSFQAGPQFAEQLNEFIADNANVALVVNEGSIQFINDEGETETLSYFEDSTAPAALSLTPDVECSEAVPVTAIQEVPKSRAYGEDSGTVPVKYVTQGNADICWAACMASIINYYKGTNYLASQVATATGNGLQGAEPWEYTSWYNNVYQIKATLVQYPLSYDVVYSHASNGRPLHASLNNGSSQNYHGHSVVVRGCYISNSVVYYRIMNPWKYNGGLLVVQMNSNGTFSIDDGDCIMTQKKYVRFN